MWLLLELAWKIKSARCQIMIYLKDYPTWMSAWHGRGACSATLTPCTSKSLPTTSQDSRISYLWLVNTLKAISFHILEHKDFPHKSAQLNSARIDPHMPNYGGFAIYIMKFLEKTWLWYTYIDVPSHYTTSLIIAIQHIPPALLNLQAPLHPSLTLCEGYVL